MTKFLHILLFVSIISFAITEIKELTWYLAIIKSQDNVGLTKPSGMLQSDQGKGTQKNSKELKGTLRKAKKP